VIWLALAFCLLAVLGSIGYAAMRAWRLSSAATAEEHAVSLTAGAERLSRAITHLQASLEELAVIRAAAAEPSDLLKSIRSVVPRK
jgi:hypothetical protein